MQFSAKAKYIHYSPYKLRPLVDVIRGKNAQYALDWLATYASRRVMPIEKVLKSAVANARNRANHAPIELVIKDFKVDQGPMYRYFKPGAMGRPTILRKRFCHLNVVLELKNKEA